MAKSRCGNLSQITLVLAAVLLALMFGAIFNGVKQTNEGLSNQKELVLVHMTGCGHCKTLMPEWKSAEKKNNTGIGMRAVEMNEDDGPELCEKHNITGFPTMILLENGKKIADYNGERNKDGLLKFLQGH
ncbi:putative thioredoxin [Chrysochromulina ericina virus CeV-01B]|jgi:thioredoxin-like negative regulator of GroEL|uniref:Thioredoxin n=1 Tax=Chrysochromulina ericina virus CeV-01B TaxID=3070830 RepID=A0A0N9QWT4_9VIRU|nr:putative thioredoxin [Chrysochromulina ericina virus]ALH22958.1 putative thioredoxin [Chrysochromulina ericina virus CeV-01B]|tara:strand:+ start:2018 stop:2407 length:390 start_codon:yes stop_codon:yes gene_type:complete